MKRLLLSIIQLLTVGLLMAQTSGYDPENPDEPFLDGYTHRLTLSASPSNGGGFGGYSSVMIVEGDSMYIYAYPSSGYKFTCWKENGFVISTTNPLKYTMGTDNSQVTAEFVYDPASPADPLSEGYKHRLKLIASPSNAGYFNSNSTNYVEIAEGAHQFIYAYPRNNYRFSCWKKNGIIISTDNPYEYVMGTSNDFITAQFAYDPANPGNPGANYFNPATGEVIIDEFSSGSLYSAVSRVVGNAGSLVRTMTVTGQMSSWDAGVVAEYPTLTSIDFSRVTGLTTLAEYAFDYDSVPCSLRTLYLPSCINSIQNHAFNGCDSLAIINCFAITPPEVDSFSLSGIPSNALLYVPAVAIPLYQANPFWRTLTIRPMTGTMATLNVNLPASVNLADYAGMFVQLRNTQNGLNVRYAITDKYSFSFENLVLNTHYNLQVVNQASKVFGRIDNITIGSNDTTVTFDSLSVPRTVTLHVKTPQGVDVTDSVEIKWYDADENYICTGDSLSSQISGTLLKVSVKLNSVLATRFSKVTLYPVTVSDTGNRFTYTLSPITKIAVSGVVTDNMTGDPVPNAKVFVHQRINGKYDVNFSMDADDNGAFSDSIISADAVFTVSAQYYLQKSDSINESVLTSGNPLNLTIPALMGQYVNIGYTFQESVRPEEQATLKNYYSDVNNVDYRLQNITTGENLIYSTNSPLLLRLSTHQTPGDTLQITASSRNDKFKDVSVRFAVDTTDALSVTIPVVEYGGMDLSYGQGAADGELFLIYNSLGQLVEKDNLIFDDTVRVKDLPDGNYFVVAIDDIDNFSYPIVLRKYYQVDLIKERDYVIDTISVVSGLINDIYFDSIPHYNTLRNRFFNKRKSSIFASESSVTVGDFVTITANIVIPDTLIPLLSNANLSFDLPSSLSFVQGSVMMNKRIYSSYIVQGNNLTIPFNIAEESSIKFCVIPSESGVVEIEGMFSVLNGMDTLRAIVSSVKISVEDLSININAPTISADETIAVSGAAKMGSTIEVYDNDILIGSTIVGANNSWSGRYQLANPTNASYHRIHAVLTQNGISVASSAVECLYDRYAVQPTMVTMEYGSYVLKYDYQNPDKSPGYLFYVPSSQSLFKFDIEFTTNDTSKVSNVILYVKDNNNQWYELAADYDTTRLKWHTQATFESYSIPVKVAVDYSCKTPNYMDVSQQRDIKQQQDVMVQQLSDSVAYYDGLLNTIDSLFVNVQDTNYLYSQIDSLLDIPEYTSGTDAVMDSLMNLTEAELIAYFDSAFAETLEDSLMFAKGDSIFQMVFLNSFSEDGVHLDMYDCNGLSPQMLRSDGYEAFATTDGDTLYIYTSDYMIKTVDFASNQMIVITIDSINGPLYARSINTEVLQNLFKKAKASAEKIIMALNFVMDGMNVVKNFAVKQRAKIWAKIKLLKNCYLPPRAEARFNAEKASATAWVKASRLGTIGRITSKFLKYANPVTALSNAILDMENMLVDMDEWNAILGGINAKCDNAKVPASLLESEAFNYAIATRDGYRVVLATDAFSLASLLITTKTARTAYGIPILIANIATTVASIKWGNMKIEESNSHQSDILFRRSKLDEYCKPKPKKIKKPNPVPNPHPNTIRYGIDPSGFVYEGVESNRLEGVTASCYYKETVEDMYGNVVDNVNLWDAEEYDQENPLLTDSMGMYQWFVPVGLWQVKLEKSGYETAYSDWLPVPPPQLDVNIGMVQNVQPTVIDASATSSAVEFQFDKYMMSGYLDTNNIHVYQNGNYVPGSIQFVNAEKAYANPDSTFASAVRFVPDARFTGSQLTLIVSNKVRSYSGLRMQETFMRTLTIASQSYFFEDTHTMCQGESFTWHGKQYSVSGVYYDSLTSVEGLDSVYQLTLTVNPVVTTNINLNACANETLPAWATGFAPGRYHHNDTLISSTGCDSIIHTLLTINRTYSFSQSLRKSSSEIPYLWHGKSLTASGVYYDSLLTIKGCDSVYQLTITFIDPYLFRDSAIICQGDNHLWRGRRYSTTGVYYDSLKTADNVDSVYQLTLTVNPVVTTDINIAACANEQLPTWVTGAVAGNTYHHYDTLTATTGCDSIIHTALKVNHTYFNQQSVTWPISSGNYNWHGKVITGTGVYYDSLTTVNTGCDSVFQLNIAFADKYLFEETHSICQGDYYDWHGQRCTQSGVYYDSLKTVAQVDSIYKLTLTVNQNYFFTEPQTICQSSSYRWHNRDYSVAGTYYDSLITASGCDSVYELTLTVNPTYFIQQRHTVCNGDAYQWHGRNLSVAGVYYDSLITTSGCDSVYEMTLTTSQTYLIQEEHSICQGDVYQWHGRNLSVAGVYYDSLLTTAGCDSVYELTLTVNNAYLIQEQHAICQGNIYQWHYLSLSSAGVYYDSLLTSAGCDSIYELTLTVNPTYSVEESAELPNDGTGYKWHGKMYYESGDYVDTLSTVFGCDSICTLHLDDAVPSAINDVKQTTEVFLVPNPIRTDGTAYIHADWSANESDDMTVEIINTAGITIARIKPKTFPIPISGINSSGIYLIRITTGSGDTYIRKLIVH